MERWEIDKLNDENWPAWKFQMMHLLEAKDMWEHVDGTAAPDGNSAAQRAAFEKVKRKAMATLVCAISSKLVYLITTCGTPKDVWDTLKGHFERNTMANKLLLKRKLFTAKMDESMPVQDHLRYMKEIADKLVALDSALAEEEQVVALLISLPSSYETLVTALEAKGEELSLEFVKQALINEEAKRQNQDTHGSGGESALLGRNGQKKPCRSGSSDSRGSRKGYRKPIKCYGCQKLGHIARNCPNRECDHGTSSEDGADWGPKEGGFQVSGRSRWKAQRSRKWYVDSGATSHICKDRKSFTTYQKFDKPKMMYVLDGGSLKVYGIGEVCLQSGNGTRFKAVKVLHAPGAEENLFSVRKATEKGATVNFWRSGCQIAKNGYPLANGMCEGNLYQLKVSVVSPSGKVDSPRSGWNQGVPGWVKGNRRAFDRGGVL